MIGHREERWRAFGWAAARLDDGLNLAPARLGGVLICLQLAGPISYDAVMHDKPFIGDGRTDASARDIGRALTVYVRACALLWLICGGLAWAL